MLVLSCVISATEKPIGVLEYNQGKTGIDLASYASALRKGVKWYRKLAFSLLTGIAVVNAWILYKRKTGKNVQIRRFREMLVAELLPEMEELAQPKIRGCINLRTESEKMGKKSEETAKTVITKK